MNIYDQLKQLWARVTDLTKNGAAADTKIAALEAAAVRIPKDYSTTETNTGLKWIDGKNIYRKVITGIIPALTESYNGNIETLSLDNLIKSEGFLTKSGSGIYNINSYRSSSIYSTIRYASGNIILSCGTAFSEFTYNAIIYYTKPTATREPDDEPETKATKAAKKKATK